MKVNRQTGWIWERVSTANIKIEIGPCLDAFKGHKR